MATRRAPTIGVTGECPEEERSLLESAHLFLRVIQYRREEIDGIQEYDRALRELSDEVGLGEDVEPWWRPARGQRSQRTGVGAARVRLRRGHLRRTPIGSSKQGACRSAASTSAPPPPWGFLVCNKHPSGFTAKLALTGNNGRQRFYRS